MNAVISSSVPRGDCSAFPRGSTHTHTHTYHVLHTHTPHEQDVCCDSIDCALTPAAWSGHTLCTVLYYI